MRIWWANPKEGFDKKTEAVDLCHGEITKGNVV